MKKLPKKGTLTNLFIGWHACISIQGCMHKRFSFNTVFGKRRVMKSGATKGGKECPFILRFPTV